MVVEWMRYEEIWVDYKKQGSGYEIISRPS